MSALCEQGLMVIETFALLFLFFLSLSLGVVTEYAIRFHCLPLRQWFGLLEPGARDTGFVAFSTHILTLPPKPTGFLLPLASGIIAMAL